jgi:aspartyl protease family protein
VVILTAVSAPAFFRDSLQRMSEMQPASAASGAGAPPRAGASSRAGSQVEIRAHRDGHFYVDAEINLRPVRLMVDTGASVIALRKSDAAAAGIRPPPGAYEHPVSTANGTAYAAEAEIDTIAVRDIELDGVRALILPDEQLGVSLLGASFLNRLERFQVSDGTLIFEN